MIDCTAHMTADARNALFAKYGVKPVSGPAPANMRAEVARIVNRNRGPLGGELFEFKVVGCCERCGEDLYEFDGECDMCEDAHDAVYDAHTSVQLANMTDRELRRLVDAKIAEWRN